MDVVYFDFCKSFQTAIHSILVMKSRKCGIDKWTVRWIENCLTGRDKKVVISGVGSGRRTVYSGVPQGSVLGQGFFNILINDLVES